MTTTPSFQRPWSSSAAATPHSTQEPRYQPRHWHLHCQGTPAQTQLSNLRTPEGLWPPPVRTPVGREPSRQAAWVEPHLSPPLASPKHAAVKNSPWCPTWLPSPQALRSARSSRWPANPRVCSQQQALQAPGEVLSEDTRGGGGSRTRARERVGCAEGLGDLA